MRGVGRPPILQSIEGSSSGEEGGKSVSEFTFRQPHSERARVSLSCKELSSFLVRGWEEVRNTQGKQIPGCSC